MATLEKCTVCGGVVATTAITCPHCGDSLRGGLQGIDNLMKERHPVFYKLATVGAWIYLLVTIVAGGVIVFVLSRAYSQLQNLLGT